MKNNTNGKLHRKYPYARLKGMDQFMAFVREPLWRPAKLDAGLLRTLDIARGKENEAITALRFLGIIDEAGAPTAVFDELKEDYQGTMRLQVQAAYADVFAVLPPKMVNQTRLVKIMGGPIDTAEYQAKLFVWMCEQAGIEVPNVEKKFHRARFDKAADELETD